LKNAILKILDTESALLEEKMLMRTENILPSWDKDKLINLAEQIQSILKVYFAESDVDKTVNQLVNTIDDKFPELGSQPSALLSILLNTRYVLFSILMLKTEYANISIDAFGHMNELYQPLVKELQNKYQTKSEDINELISQDFSSVKSLSLSSLSHAGMGIFILDKHFNFIYWSAGLEKIFHKNGREALGTSFTGRCNPTDMEPRVCDAVRLAIEDGVHTDLIASKHPFPDSGEKYLNYLIAPLKNDKNNVIGASVLVHDVTQHRQSEQALEKYEQYFKTVLDDAADAIILLDENDCIVMWNKAAEKLYGWREIEVLGQPVTIIVPDDPKSQKEIEKIGRIIRQKGFVQSYRSERITRFGKRVTIEITRSAIKNDKGEFIGSSAITRDITEDEQLRGQLVQSEKLSAVGTLAAGIAHEIGSPLMSISSLAQMLQMDTND
jgi:PAS domain S-box-containing protein